MKVRIVKCKQSYFWYNDQIESIINVKYEYNHSDEWAVPGIGAILKEDCEILESDVPKPEPFDLERALKGEPFLLKRGGNHLWYLIGKSKFGYQSEHGVNYYIEVNLPHHGTPTINTATKEHLNREYEMAPREPEYQTVWVNLYDEKESNDFIAYAYSTKEDAMRAKAENFYIGTFPITFKNQNHEF